MPNFGIFAVGLETTLFCFRSGCSDLAAVQVTEIMTAGMEAYVPLSVKSFSPSNPWFNHACSMAVKARGRAYRLYQTSASSHSDYF